MADSNRRRTGAIQDTGNPVLDTTTNLIMNWPCDCHFPVDQIDLLFEKIAELHQREGERFQGKIPKPKSLRQMKHEAEEVGAR